MAKTKLYIAALFLIFIFLEIFPKDFFDEGQTLCPSVVYRGQECIACGMTRGLSYALHFDFIKAYSLNVGAIFLAAFFFLLWIIELVNSIKALRLKQEEYYPFKFFIQKIQVAKSGTKYYAYLSVLLFLLFICLITISYYIENQ